MELFLDIIDDRINIGEINYHTDKWFLSSRNTVSDLFRKINREIYNTVNNSNYEMGQFIDIKILHDKKIYTNADEYSNDILDINNNYNISIISDVNDYVNIYINGSIQDIIINASDERQTVVSLTSDIFENIHIDNLNYLAMDLYAKIRIIINQIYTISEMQSDYKIMIYDDFGCLLDNGINKLTSLKYHIVINATSSLYIKGVNDKLYINIDDKVIHLETIKLDKTEYKYDMTNKVYEVKQLIYNQINSLTSSLNSENLLIVSITQNNSKLKDNEYLNKDLAYITVVPNNSVNIQRFQGELNFSIYVKDNRLDLSDKLIKEEFNNYLNSVAPSTVITYLDFKQQIILFFQKYNNQIVLEDLEIYSINYKNDKLLEFGSFEFLIKESLNTRRIKGELDNIIISVANVSNQSINSMNFNNVQFSSYDNEDNLHILTQISKTEVVVYDNDLINYKYKFNITNKEKILDFKTTHNGLHDFWLIEENLEFNNYKQINFYKDNKIINSWKGKSYLTIASINPEINQAYFRDMPNQDLVNYGSIYLINSIDCKKIKLDEISTTLFEINQIQAQRFGFLYIKSNNTIYKYDVMQKKVKKVYDLTNIQIFSISNNNDHSYEYTDEGLMRDEIEIVNTNKLNSYLIPETSQLFNTQLIVDKNNNFYYLRIDYLNHMFYIVKNGISIFSIKNDNTAASLHLNKDKSCVLIVGSSIFRINS